MTWKSWLIAGLVAANCAVVHAAGHGVATACRASLNLADAKALAVATPNSRAFVDNLHASLSTVVEGQSAGTVAVRVMAHRPMHGVQLVGVYTVNLRTGHVTDDDQEPAEDQATAATRDRLIAKHCR